MTARRVTMCLSVRGALRELNASRAKKSYYNDDDGKALTRLEAIEALQDQLSMGREKIPMSKSCGNPCKNAGCAGFDYGKEGGCPGYEIEDAPLATTPQAPTAAEDAGVGQ